MKFAWLPDCPEVDKIDLLTGRRQIYQGEVPDISRYFVDNLNSADVLVVPNDAKYWTKEYLLFITEFSRNKLILYFNRGDFPKKYRIRNSVSVQLFKQPNNLSNVYLLPPNIVTLADLPFRKLHSSPTLSFVGYLPKVTPSRVLRSFILNPKHPILESGALIRRMGIRHISSSSYPTVIQIRDHYGGAKSLISDPDLFRQEFKLSIDNSDIVFAPRGDANYSQRYFEVLSAGRIPILPDTRMTLPKLLQPNPFFHLVIDALSSNLERVVDNFWADLSLKKYKEIQKNNRVVFEQSFDYSLCVHRLFSFESIEKLIDSSSI